MRKQGFQTDSGVSAQNLAYSDYVVTHYPRCYYLIDLETLMPQLSQLLTVLQTIIAMSHPLYVFSSAAMVSEIY